MAPRKNVWERNFAEVGKIRDRVREVFVPRIKRVRSDRQEAESHWIRFFNMWNVTHDDYHMYRGRSKLYIPEVRKNVESMARVLTKAAFPSDDFFDCSPGPSGTKKGADLNKSVRRWQLEQMRIRPKWHIFARQEVLYGTSPLMVAWSKKMQWLFRSSMDPKTGKIKPTRELIEQYNAPQIYVKDLFKWYALNPNKYDFQEDGCVEFEVVSETDLNAMEKSGWLWGKDKILEGSGSAYRMDELQKDVERAEAIGLQIQNEGYAGEANLSKDADEDGDTEQSPLCARIFCPLVLPEACLDGEDPDVPIPCEIRIFNNEHVGMIRRNPFFHQSAPYLLGRYILPHNMDSVYGQGVPWAIQYMQYEANSKAEQSMDSSTLALNPLAFIDPGLVNPLNDFSIEPGGVWFVSPQGVKLGSLPDTTATGYAAINQLRGQMMDYSDRSPALPPQLQGKSRTATQSDIIANAIQIDHESFVANNEIEVLQPMMAMMESLTDQNIEDDQVIMILGRRATDWKRTLVPKKALLGRYEYFWKGASHLQNKAILSRQIIDAIKVAGTLPPQFGLKIDANEIFKVLWNEGLGLPDGDKVFGTPEDLQMQDPELLYRMVQLGLEVEVLPGDNEEMAIKFLTAKIEDEKDKNVKAELVRLVFMYEKQLQIKQSIQRQQAAQLQLQIELAKSQAGGQRSGGRSQGSGNRTQLSPNSSAGDMGSGVRS